MKIGPGQYGPSARFTPAGMDALRTMARDRRALDPKQYANVRAKLGSAVDDGAGTAAV